MTTALIAPDELAELEHHWSEPRTIRAWIATVDHKRIGLRYLVTASVFFAAGGVEALIMRTQLAQPEQNVVGPEAYSQLFSMHGITMIFLFITPMLSGFGNYLVPLMIGSRDMAFPRLNALSYWVYLASGLFMYASLPIGHAPDAGWFNYAPLTTDTYSPGSNIDFYAIGLIFLAISTTAGAINFIVTILKLRAPGMSLNRLPLFCWAILAMAFSVVFALPALTGANVLLELQRAFRFHVFDAEGGGDPILWQHLFWIFGHPDVYIIFLPAVGIVSSIIPVMARRPIVAYPWLVLATLTTAFVGFGVWAHHMFAVGLPVVSLGFFSAASAFIAIPSGVQVVAWITTLWTGRPRFDTPLLFTIGFMLLFVIGGVTGVMFAVIPFDQQVTDSYFVVAHFHYVLFGGAVFPIFAGMYYWMPKFTGRRLGERLGRISFWTMFVGFNLAFFPMHIMGLAGMPRRVYTYRVDDGLGILNLISTIGAFVLAVGIVLTLVNIALVRRQPLVESDPWHGDTLEWTVPSPPPAYNFARIPTVTSLHPAWEPSGQPASAEPLVAGHLTIESSPLEGRDEAVLEMPDSSLLPICFAAAALLASTGTLLRWWWLAALGAAVMIAALIAWQWHNLAERRDPTVTESVGSLPVGRSPAWWGMGLLIATEAMLFAILLVSYLFLRYSATPSWPPPGIDVPTLPLPLVMTALLIASSVPMHLAVRRARKHETGAARIYLAATLVLGTAFLALQAFEYSDKLQHFGPRKNAYASMFYITTSFHALHLVAGMALVVWAMTAIGKPTSLAVSTVENVGFYWHFVDAVWIAVFATLYLTVAL